MARGKATSRVASRRDRSALPPSLAFMVATPGLSHCRWGLRKRKRLAEAGMGQRKVMGDLEHRELMPQAVFALAERGDPSPSHCHALEHGQVEALHKGGVEVPTTCRQDLLEPFHSANHPP